MGSEADVLHRGDCSGCQFNENLVSSFEKVRQRVRSELEIGVSGK